jgi:hypothetical protein
VLRFDVKIIRNFIKALCVESNINHAESLQDHVGIEMLAIGALIESSAVPHGPVGVDVYKSNKDIKGLPFWLIRV